MEPNDRLAALEFIAEEVLPLLIATSPARAEITAVLERWEARDTSIGEQIALGEWADKVLKRLNSAD